MNVLTNVSEMHVCVWNGGWAVQSEGLGKGGDADLMRSDPTIRCDPIETDMLDGFVGRWPHVMWGDGGGCH